MELNNLILLLLSTAALISSTRFSFPQTKSNAYSDLKWYPCKHCVSVDVKSQSLNLTSCFKVANLLLNTENNRNHRSALNYLTAVLLATSFDVEVNPGPIDEESSKSNETAYPCGTCDKNVSWEDKALRCDSCDVWYHTQCEDVRYSFYEQLGNSSCSWECHHCGAPNYCSIIFDSSSNNMSNFYEPLTPSYISDTSSYSASMSPGNPQFSSSPTTTRKAAPTKKTKNKRTILEYDRYN